MTLDINTHRSILIKILKDLFTDIHLGPNLGFKGGTAAHLFYDLDRFSVDLDLDLLDDGAADDVFERVRSILAGYGRLKIADKKRYTLFFLLAYKNKDINAQNIKVEINRRDFGSTYGVLNYLGIAMKVMVQADMAAHKLVTLYERAGRASRDIYDVNYILKNDWPINQSIIKKRTDMEPGLFYQQCVTVLQKVDQKTILSGMGELITDKQKHWVRNSLVSDTIFLLNLEMNNLKGSSGRKEEL